MMRLADELREGRHGSSSSLSLSSPPQPPPLSLSSAILPGCRDRCHSPLGHRQPPSLEGRGEKRRKKSWLLTCPMWIPR